MAVTIKWLCIVLGLALLAGGIGFWRHHVVTKRAALAHTSIQQALTTADFVSARSALAGIADPQRRTAMEHEIRLAELHSALTYRDTGLMRRALAPDGPTWIPPQLLEAAELELAREAIQSRDFESYQKSAANWQAKTTMAGQWKLLEADQLLARKLPDEAAKLLKEARLSGAEDAMRHSRLALLEAKEPWKAMAHLDEGLKADPRNADLLSFRAQIEEAAGRVEDARLDYVAAVLAERNNPLYRDILANFYLRHGDLANAAQTWRDAAQDSGLGVYALKCWFWSRVAGVPVKHPLPPCRQPGWSELVTALTAAPDGVFWNDSLEAAATRVHGGNPRPETVWLRLLESLRLGDLKPARRQLDIGFPHEADRLWPDLALRLRVHLAARDGQNPRLPLAAVEPPSVPDNAHPFLIGFSTWAKRTETTGSNEKFEAWLAKPGALTGILLASGWGGAALIMGQAGQLVPDPEAPGWFDYGYAKSLLMRDGKGPARQWLESLPARSSAADLLLGELRLSSGAVDQGLALLQQIANGTSPLASRAAWTLALAELDRGKPAQARQITLASPGLAASVPGREILARIALAEGARAETLRIYQELGEQSADAMIFLSKEAFAAGDFEQALKWTARLARQFPEQPAFRQNLLEIHAAAKRAKP
jgi:Tfp pilus assembly protein PilF